MNFCSENGNKTLISRTHELGKIFLVTFSLASFFSPPEILAMGKKRQTDSPPPKTTETQAYPTRLVSMGKMKSTPFMLPNGRTRIDMAIFVPDLLTTGMVDATTKLRSRGILSPDPYDCETGQNSSGQSQDRFVMCGGLTAFEADIFTAAVRLGYRPGVGDIGSGSLTGGEGKLTVTISRLEMDYHIYDTYEKVVVAVGHGDALAGRGKLEVEMDFGEIDNDWDFVYDSPLTPIFRKVINDSLLMMVNNSKTNFYMAWQNKVIRLNQQNQTIYIEAGLHDDIAANNIFTIIDHNGWRVGEAKVKEVQIGYSILEMVEKNPQTGLHEKDNTGKLFNSVREGDGVLIFYHQVPR